MKTMVRVPYCRARSASAMTCLISLIPASTAENSMNSALVMRAMIFASVVLPVPGGPQKIRDPVSSRSICVCSGFPGPIKCSCPAYSSSVRGRMRSASGRVRSVEVSTFGAGWKSPMENYFTTESRRKPKLIENPALEFFGFLRVSVVDSSFSLSCGFIQYDARSHAGVERFHLRSVWDANEFIHLSHYIAWKSGALVAEENSNPARQVRLR